MFRKLRAWWLARRARRLEADRIAKAVLEERREETVELDRHGI